MDLSTDMRNEREIYRFWRNGKDYKHDPRSYIDTVLVENQCGNTTNKY